jgi:DNA-binding transcriptional ArsR family regulator
MELKIQLVRNGEVIFEMPLSRTSWSKKKIESEFETIEEDFDRFSRIFTAFSNQTRLRMMRCLLENEDNTMSFADFMRDLDLNPKIVWENARKLREGGLLEKTSRGKYSCSNFGHRVFMMMSFALRHLQEELEDLEEY